MLRRLREPVPAELSFFSAQEWNAFVRLVEDGLRQRRLPFTRQGTGVDLAAGGLGLVNLAQSCHDLPRSAWPPAVAEFLELVSTTFSGEPQHHPVDPGLIKVRLYADDYFPPDEVDVVAQPFAESVVAALTMDEPTGIRTVTPLELAGIGVEGAAAFDLGWANVGREPPPEVQWIDVDGRRVETIEGPSFYTASWVTWLDQLVAVPPEGALVALPTRHLVLAHPIGEQGFTFTPPDDFVGVLNRLPPE